MRMTDSAAGRAVRVDQIDLFPAAFYATGEPHAAWHLLRDEAPVLRQQAPDGTPFWSVTRYRDVVAVLRDTAVYSSEHSTMLSAMHGDIAKGRAMHLTDPPRHGRMRKPVVGFLSTGVMRTHEPRIRARIAALVRSGLAGGEIDFARLVAMLPMLVAGDILGIPEDRWPETARWTQASVAPEDPAYRAGSPQATLMQAHVYLLSLFGELIAERRKRPTDDLISLLIAAPVDDRPPTDEDVTVNCYGFLIGSNITTPQVAAHLAMAVADEPLVWQKVRSDPALVPGTMEEALRWSTPTNHLLRRTRAATRLGDQELPEGALVCAWVASANRDERMFADPFAFDPARRPNPHIAFGVGPHRCVGDSAARLGLTILVEELAAQVEAIEVTGPVTHLASNFLNGVTSLPVVLHPGSDR